MQYSRYPVSLKEWDVLVVDDSPGIRTFLNVSFGEGGARIHEAASAHIAMEIFKRVSPDLVIMDLGLPDRDGLDLIPEFKNTGRRTPPIIVLSVRNDHYTRSLAMERGASAYVTKPFLMEELYERIAEVMKKN